MAAASQDRDRKNREMRRHGRLFAFLVTVAVSLTLTWMPVYSGDMTATAPGGQPVTRSVHATLIEINGMWRAMLFLGFPVIVSFAPVLVPRLRLIAAVVMLWFSLVSAFSVGMFYIPSAILLFWSKR
jgi:hypothetical protein